MSVDTTQQHEQLIQAMMTPEGWPTGGSDRHRIDTHISTVVLAGDKAYKLKKPLDLGFLDFLSLASREQACHAELRLNRRLAPDLYEAVCRVTGTLEHPEIDGTGALLDWAVRMRRFDPDAVLSNHPEALGPALIDELAERVGSFHSQVDCAPPDPQLTGSQAACGPMFDNFDQIGDRIGRRRPDLLDHLQGLARWTDRFCEDHRALLDARSRAGKVCECHGDLHLGNIALIDGRPVVFDAIEFSPALRWIDPINDAAFLTMDLRQRQRPALAHRFVNRYLQITGDYEGLALLQGFEVYRALVRAKIAAIRSGQSDIDETDRRQVEDELQAYLTVAADLAATRRGAVVVLHGVSGSGKSHVAQTLVDQLPAVVVRSDLERKRLLGLEATSDATGHGGYDAGVTRQTYQRLTDAARVAADSGYVAVADATFLQRADRQSLAELANSLGVPYAIIACEAPTEVLERRIARRANLSGNVSDADRSVLYDQLAAREPLDSHELERAIRVEPERPLDATRLAALLSIPIGDGAPVR
jgi:hypothetical protein